MFDIYQIIFLIKGHIPILISLFVDKFNDMDPLWIRTALFLFFDLYYDV